MKHWMIIYGTVLFIGCNSDSYFGPVYMNDNNDTIGGSMRLIVGCEGNFQFNNAEISLIDLDQKSIANSRYREANGSGLGDVLQSMLIAGDTLICVLNNSGLLRLLDKSTFKEIGVFNGLNSPRYALGLGDQRFAVTDLYADHITIVSLKKLEIEGVIKIEGWTEQLLQLVSGEAVVANLDKNSLVLCDFIGQDVKDEIQLPCRPEKLVRDEKGGYVVAGQDLNDNKASIVMRYDSSYDLSWQLYLTEPIFGASIFGDSLYILHRGKITVYDLVNHVMKWTFEHEAQTPYGFLATTQGIFVTDAKDYLSNGKVYWYDLSGNLVSVFNSGALPQALTIDF